MVLLEQPTRINPMLVAGTLLFIVSSALLLTMFIRLRGL
jgi:hypothetical protein